MSFSTRVLDEDLSVLIEALQYIKFSRQEDGSYRIDATIPNEVALPFARAVMRREARLLREDADRLGVVFVAERTPEQRRTDAFVDLVMSVSSARRYFGTDLSPS